MRTFNFWGPCCYGIFRCFGWQLVTDFPKKKIPDIFLGLNGPVLPNLFDLWRWGRYVVLETVLFTNLHHTTFQRNEDLKYTIAKPQIWSKFNGWRFDCLYFLLQRRKSHSELKEKRRQEIVLKLEQTGFAASCTEAGKWVHLKLSKCSYQRLSGSSADCRM